MDESRTALERDVAGEYDGNDAIDPRMPAAPALEIAPAHANELARNAFLTDGGSEARDERRRDDEHPAAELHGGVLVVRMDRDRKAGRQGPWGGGPDGGRRGGEAGKGGW